MSLNYIDLFSGAGGMSIGIKSAGGNLLFSNEIDKSAVLTQKTNLEKLGDNPNKVIECSIEELHREVIGGEVRFEFQGEVVNSNKVNEKLYKNKSYLDESIIKHVSNVKNVDLIVGGPPCQGFSNAARGKKSKLEKNYVDFIDDPRNQLFKYFLEFVEYYSPKAVIIENVKGLSTAKGYRKLIEDSLENTGVGYSIASIILNSSAFGIPQNRERIFFIGIRNDIKDADLFTFQINSKILNFHRKKISLKDSIDDLPKIISNPKPLNTKAENEIPIGEKNSFGEYCSKRKYEDLIKKKSDYVRRINIFLEKEIIPDYLYNHKSRYNNPDDLNIYSKLVPGVALTNEKNKIAYALNKYSTKAYGDKYYKLDPDKPSRTIVAHLQMDNNGYVHYGDIPRGISPREAARIQSFPDWYEFKGPFTNQFKQIGNAVPPLLAKELYNIINGFLEGGIDNVF